MSSSTASRLRYTYTCIQGVKSHDLLDCSHAYCYQRNVTCGDMVPLHVRRTSLPARNMSLVFLSDGHVPTLRVRGSSSSTAPARGALRRPASVGDIGAHTYCMCASTPSCSAYSKE